jgi:hypothetical protein
MHLRRGLRRSEPLRDDDVLGNPAGRRCADPVGAPSGTPPCAGDPGEGREPPVAPVAVEVARELPMQRGLDPRSMPFVLQYNKRDLPNIVPIQEMERMLNPTGVPHFEAVATRGIGIFDTLKDVSKQVIKHLS